MKWLVLVLIFLACGPTIADGNLAGSVTALQTSPSSRINSNTSDVTTQFQAMVTDAVKSSGSIYLPCGTYRISKPIFIENGVNFNMGGESSGCVTVFQMKNATPIFEITGINSHFFRIHDLTATWARQDTSKDADIVQINMDSDNSAFNFEMDHVCGVNGSRMLSESPNSLMWGVNFHDNWRDASMTGSIVYAQPDRGIPRYIISNNYAFIGSVQTETLYKISNVGQFFAVNNEFNGSGKTPFDGSKIHLFDLGQLSGDIDGVNVEATYTKGGGSFIDYRNGGVGQHLELHNLTLDDHVTDASPFYGIFISSSSGQTSSPSASVVSIDGELTAAYTDSLGILLPYMATYTSEISHVSGISWEDGAGRSLGHYNPNEADGGNYQGAYPIIDYDIQPSNFTRSVGDADEALTLRVETGGASAKVLEFDASLTTNRTVKLPSAGIDDGTEFKIIRNAPTPGPYTLTVRPGGGTSGPAYVCAANSRCFVWYRAISARAWIIEAAGSLP